MEKLLSPEFYEQEIAAAQLWLKENAVVLSVATLAQVMAIGLLDIGFAPERVAKILNKEAAQIKARPEWARHQG